MQACVVIRRLTLSLSDELHRFQPTFFTGEIVDKITATIQQPLERYGQSTIKRDKTERMRPELFPPGRCVHFYRDGYGTSVAVIPNDFFHEIDVSRRMIDGV